MADRKVCGAILFGCVFALLVSTGYSQSTPQRGAGDLAPADTPQRDADGNLRPADNEAGSAVLHLMEMNASEAAAGKMAIEKAQSPLVKAFAEMMVNDHTQALTKIQAWQGTSAPSTVKPNARHRQEIDKLSALSGADFDHAYMTAMVSDHQEAVKFLQHLAGTQPGATVQGQTLAPSTNLTGSDKDVTVIVQELLPTTQQHLQQAQQIQNELKGSSDEKPIQPNPKPLDANGKTKPAGG